MRGCWLGGVSREYVSWDGGIAPNRLHSCAGRTAPGGRGEHIYVYIVNSTQADTSELDNLMNNQVTVCLRMWDRKWLNYW